MTHLPTKLTAQAQEERSQHRNRKLAVARLLKRLEEKKQVQEKQVNQEQWELHGELERGNAVRVYQGPHFKLKQ